MKKRTVLTLATAIILASNMAMTAYAIDDCKHTETERTVILVERFYLNPSEHEVYHTYMDSCENCGKVVGKGEYFAGVEYHDYYLDIDKNLLICGGCGDSYEYTR